ncbi:hypothetical protein LTR85_009363 [Meristemomyces frigidus]|nr:hypothetical protein LTR85_009363 [Meristemomyces frigidus]
MASIFAVPVVGYAIATYQAGYRRWMAMGPGGLPANHFGYVANNVIEAMFARKDTRDVSLYDQPEQYAAGWVEVSDKEKAMAQTSFLSGALPRRKGTQAHALRFVIPQREHFAQEYQNSKVKEAYVAAFEHLQADNKAITEWKVSGLEGRGQALFLTPSVAVPKLASKTGGEICHVHKSDLSGHLTLSLADAKEVVAKGWGERHRLSGSRLHLGYTMTYVPRTVEEVEVFVRIHQAGIDYMRSTGS